MTGPFLKDPGDRVDYVVDFEDWLAGDTIASVSWELPDGITNFSTSNTTTSATIWLSSGTHGQDYTITCQATTAGGRIKQQSFTVRVRNNVA